MFTGKIWYLRKASCLAEHSHLVLVLVHNTHILIILKISILQYFQKNLLSYTNYITYLFTCLVSLTTENNHGQSYSAVWSINLLCEHKLSQKIMQANDHT